MIKNLIGFSAMLLILSACSTSGRYFPEKGICEESPPLFSKILQSAPSDAYQNCIYQIESQKKIRDFYEKYPELLVEMEKMKVRRSQATKFGTPLNEFIYCFGEPDTKELVNGDNVYWYDGQTPIFVSFKNDKLSSLTIDRETLRDRRTAEHQSAIIAILNRPPPTVSTDCYRIGDKVHCTTSTD